MPLTGLEVYKLLPKTNCKECGPPTCLAFAMQLASGKAALDACPHMPEEARQHLMAASEPPMRSITLGPSGRTVTIGGESVVFRHEKKFINAPPIFVDISDLADIEYVKNLRFERVGQSYGVEGFAFFASDPGAVEEALCASKASGLVLLLSVKSAGILTPYMEALRALRPAIVVPPSHETEPYAALSAKTGCPLVSFCMDTHEVAGVAQKYQAMGVRDLIVAHRESGTCAQAAFFSRLRRGSLRQNLRTLGLPTIAYAHRSNSALLCAISHVSKYASAIVTPRLSHQEFLSLLTWRHDLYSDPERPIQVQSKLYTVGQPGPNSPLYITTNFSLTFYSVENEVSASRLPGYILPVDTDGTSVLTAWAAGKFTAEKVREALDQSGANDVVEKRLAIVPGYVSQLAKKVEQATGWTVIIGPQEASAIPAFARSLKI